MRTKILVVFFTLFLATNAIQALDIDDWFEHLWLHQATDFDDRSKTIWLPSYKVDIEALEIAGIENNLSGISYNFDTKHLWVVTNDPQQLHELDDNLQVLRTVVLKNFTDTEAVAYAGKGQFVIADERDQTLVIAEVSQHTTELDKNNLRKLTLGTHERSNKGLEGVAVDRRNKSIYAVREREPMQLIKFDGFLEQQDALHISFPHRDNIGSFGLDDLSGLHYDSRTNHLLILSDETKMLLELTRKGEKVSYMNLEEGLNELKKSIPQAEGVTLDGNNNLYIVSEPNLIYRFKRF